MNCKTKRGRVRCRRDNDGNQHRVVIVDGVEGHNVTFTTSCSGCCELGDYMGNAHNYPYDERAQCHVGSGCDECGYRGKRRVTHFVPFDHAEVLAAITKEKQ